MADLTPGDPAATNGASDHVHKPIASDAGETTGDDQTLAGRDQTLQDADQTASDSDQTAADGDQTAADADQAASDRDLVHGGDARVHDLTQELRDRSALQREHSAQQRVAAASDRDQIAHARDLVALARDQAAERHDRELAARDTAAAGNGRAMSGAEIVARAAEDRRRAATDRAAAADGRARAARNREHAAADRERAARDREHARADRETLLAQLVILETDQLTGARTRAAGLVDIEHEIDRARRAAGLLVIAYVDVVGLKPVNDKRGHAAGDTLLRRAVHGIRSHLRSYDLIVRMGGDEFVCVMPGATIQDARQRFAAIQTDLAATPDRCEIRIGYAELAQDDNTADLIERADAQLHTSRAR